ncbi:flavin reductase [Rhizobium ruizarguesonis]|uniref:flavin reductase n=1 Tax=Rhizobium ruizarguesonis TaxID=2081791 RepID=UPI001031C962|nr:flavin reductase [Rhizobium ruizarguesonis]TAT96072.1 FMN reductase [Rhizobium ruizarguesonis]
MNVLREVEMPGVLVDRQLFRSGMARLAAGVNIITSAGANGRCGFTASAVCSVTDDPPTLMVCINRGSQSYEAIKANGILCVNTVAGAHEELSMRFAGANGVKDMETRFAGGEWQELVTGAPSLAGAVVSFDCRLSHQVAVGTHDVLFCEVVAVHTSEDVEGLVYFGRKFHRLSA